MEYVIGIDVGSGSVRGALVDKTGKTRKVNTKDIATLNSKPDYYTQSADEVWLSCCQVIKVSACQLRKSLEHSAMGFKVIDKFIREVYLKLTTSCSYSEAVSFYSPINACILQYYYLFALYFYFTFSIYRHLYKISPPRMSKDSDSTPHVH